MVRYEKSMQQHAEWVSTQVLFDCSCQGIQTPSLTNHYMTHMETSKENLEVDIRDVGVKTCSPQIVY